MKRLIKGASYDPNDHSHDHQDPEMAKAMIIDAGLNRMALVKAGDALAARLRGMCPQAGELHDWEQAKK
jgi:hypothetical protein